MTLCLGFKISSFHFLDSSVGLAAKFLSRGKKEKAQPQLPRAGPAHILSGPLTAHWADI